MFTSLLLMSCAQAAPPAAPAKPAAATPAAIVAPSVVEMPGGGCGGGCGSCGSGICPGAMDPCPFEKKGIFAKIRNAFRPKDKCVECVPPPAKDKSQKLLFGRFHRPVNYCGAAGAAGGGCGTGGCGSIGCSSCGLPPIPGSVPMVATPVAPAPAPVVPMPEKPATPPAGEGKPAADSKNKVNVVIPAVPAPMPAPTGKPAF